MFFPLFTLAKDRTTHEIYSHNRTLVYILLFIHIYILYTSFISRSDEFFIFLYVTRACVCVLSKQAKERTTTRVYFESYYIIYKYVYIIMSYVEPLSILKRICICTYTYCV